MLFIAAHHRLAVKALQMVTHLETHLGLGAALPVPSPVPKMPSSVGLCWFHLEFSDAVMPAEKKDKDRLWLKKTYFGILL